MRRFLLALCFALLCAVSSEGQVANKVLTRTKAQLDALAAQLSANPNLDFDRRQVYICKDCVTNCITDGGSGPEVPCRYDPTTMQFEPVSGTGGSGTPGGSNKQLQFNNSGSFGGTDACEWNNTDDAIECDGSFRGNLFAYLADAANTYLDMQPGDGPEFFSGGFQIWKAWNTGFFDLAVDTTLTDGSGDSPRLLWGVEVNGSWACGGVDNSENTLLCENDDSTVTVVNFTNTGAGAAEIRQDNVAVCLLNGTNCPTQAPASAQYLTLALDATLSAERTFAAGLGLSATDGGANGAYTLGFSIAALGTDPALGAHGVSFGQSELVFEGATNDANETRIVVTDPTGERTQTIPDASGEFSLLGQTIADSELTGQIGAAHGGTGDDTSATTGVSRIVSGNWTYDAGVSHLASSSSADFAGTCSNETGTGLLVFNDTPTLIDPQVGGVQMCLEDGTNCPGAGGGTIEYLPDNYPPSGDNLGSDEFTNDTPSLTWTQRNADGQSVTYVRDAVVLGAGGVSDAWHGDTTGVPSDTGQDWYMVAKVSARLLNATTRGCGISLITSATGGNLNTPTEINSVYIRATSATAAAIEHTDHDDYDFAGSTNIGGNDDVAVTASDITQLETLHIYFALHWIDSSEDIRSSWSWDGLQWTAGNTDTAVDGYPIGAGKFSRDDESCIFEFVRFLDTDVDSDGTTLLRIGS